MPILTLVTLFWLEQMALDIDVVVLHIFEVKVIFNGRLPPEPSIWIQHCSFFSSLAMSIIKWSTCLRLCPNYNVTLRHLRLASTTLLAVQNPENVDRKGQKQRGRHPCSPPNSVSSVTPATRYTVLEENKLSSLDC